jgi:hypothetical protein
VTTWTDKTGRMLAVMPAEGDSPARLVVALPGAAHPVAFWLDGEADVAEVAVALFTANGHRAPVITPRPDVDVSAPLVFGPLRFRVAGRGVAVQAGAVREEWSPGRTRQVAGAMVALADAAESRPDLADVARLAALVVASREKRGGWPLDEGDLAADLLRAGVTLPAEGDGNG